MGLEQRFMHTRILAIANNNVDFYSGMHSQYTDK